MQRSKPSVKPPTSGHPLLSATDPSARSPSPPCSAPPPEMPALAIRWESCVDVRRNCFDENNVATVSQQRASLVQFRVSDLGIPLVDYTTIRTAGGRREARYFFAGAVAGGCTSLRSNFPLPSTKNKQSAAGSQLVVCRYLPPGCKKYDPGPSRNS